MEEKKAPPRLMSLERMQAVADKFTEGKTLHRVSGILAKTDPRDASGQPVLVDALGGVLVAEDFLLEVENEVIPIFEDRLAKTIAAMSRAFYESGGKGVHDRHRIIRELGGVFRFVPHVRG